MLGAAPVARLLFRQAVEPVSLSAGRSWRQLATLVASTDAEVAVADKLKLGLKGPSKIVVKDTSGGCGAMYSIEVVAEDFRGQSKLKQHQLVHKLIAEDVKKWHGYTLDTKTP